MDLVSWIEFHGLSFQSADQTGQQIKAIRADWANAFEIDGHLMNWSSVIKLSGIHLPGKRFACSVGNRRCVGEADVCEDAIWRREWRIGGQIEGIGETTSWYVREMANRSRFGVSRWVMSHVGIDDLGTPWVWGRWIEVPIVSWWRYIRRRRREQEKRRAIISDCKT